MLFKDISEKKKSTSKKNKSHYNGMGLLSGPKEIKCSNCSVLILPDYEKNIDFFNHLSKREPYIDALVSSDGSEPSNSMDNISAENAPSQNIDSVSSDSFNGGDSGDSGAFGESLIKDINSSLDAIYVLNRLI